ncbi:UDP-glucose--undecaprenyl-phosphate glucosyltransferase [Geobacter metallireducens GS-15]|uniref:dolichyl-phosphate beta-glucosyltransferase n=1 Tax=Geobacter metallireducens (strain ATCC 53774 / DSM 7210 / GS-15) TaxID=269799 RepID=Q39Z37_GEOMG|nr:UDP-glucose--undecaprenyl-phosphate glucosyltransferase [Geobacter metallireducens GS-15]
MSGGPVKTPFLSFIIPAYNEEQRLPSYLERVIGFFAGQSYSFEIVVVDDGSSDGTAALVKALMAQHSCLRLEALDRNRGKGFAVKTGMSAAKGQLRVFADADGATPVEEIRRLLDAREQGADIAIGSRAMRSDECIVQGRVHRKIMGTVFNGLIRALAVRGIHDSQCGFKLFTASAAEDIFPRQRITGFGFDVELLFLARRLGYVVVEVPVNWSDVEGTKVRLVRDSFRMLGEVLRIRFTNLTGGYGDIPGKT